MATSGFQENPGSRQVCRNHSVGSGVDLCTGIAIDLQNARAKRTTIRGKQNALFDIHGAGEAAIVAVKLANVGCGLADQAVTADRVVEHDPADPQLRAADDMNVAGAKRIAVVETDAPFQDDRAARVSAGLAHHYIAGPFLHEQAGSGHERGGLQQLARTIVIEEQRRSACRRDRTGAEPDKVIHPDATFLDVGPARIGIHTGQGGHAGAALHHATAAGDVIGKGLVGGKV